MLKQRPGGNEAEEQGSPMTYDRLGLRGVRGGRKASVTEKCKSKPQRSYTTHPAEWLNLKAEIQSVDECAGQWQDSHY